MDCPVCSATQPESDGTECVQCGVVFAKVRAGHARAQPDRISAARYGHRTLAPGRSASTRATLVAHGTLYLFVLIWTWRFVSQPMGTAAANSFLHGVNLVFHEAGHILFLPFGGFLTALGGSVTQVLIPLVCLFALVRQNGDAFGGSLALWWTGENLLDLAPYIADARALELVLLGGFTGREVEGHDWEAILTALNWLEYDRVLGQSVHWLGVVVMIVGLVWGALTLNLARTRATRPVVLRSSRDV